MTIRETLQQIAELAPRISDADHRLSRVIVVIERLLRVRNVRRVISVPLVPGVKLGWSARMGDWRLVIVDDEGSVPVRHAEPDEVVELFTSGAIQRLVEAAL